MAQGHIVVHTPESYLEDGVSQSVSLGFNDNGVNELDFNIGEIEEANIGTFYTSYYDGQGFFVKTPIVLILTAYNYLFPFIYGRSIMGIYEIVSYNINWNDDLHQLALRSRNRQLGRLSGHLEEARSAIRMFFRLSRYCSAWLHLFEEKVESARNEMIGHV